MTERFLIKERSEQKPKIESFGIKENNANIQFSGLELVTIEYSEQPNSQNRFKKMIEMLLNASKVFPDLDNTKK